MTSIDDSKQELWNEICDTTVRVAHIKAHRDAEWYLCALRLVREAEDRLIDGLTDAITAWRVADELRNGSGDDS